MSGIQEKPYRLLLSSITVKLMRSRKFLTIILVTCLLLGTIYADVVQADEGAGEEEAYKSTPPQVITEIAIAGIVLKVLSYFDLP